MAMRHDVSLCGQRTVYVPLRQISSVEQGRCCCGCLYCIDIPESPLGSFLPGMGCCHRQSTAEVTALLQERLHEAQVRRRDQTAERWDAMNLKTKHLSQKLDCLWKHVLGGDNDHDDGMVVVPPPYGDAMADRGGG